MIPVVKLTCQPIFTMRLQRQGEIIIQSPSGTMERLWHGDLMMTDRQMFPLTPYLSCRSLPELIIILPSPMMVALWLGDWMIQGKRMFPTRCHPCLVWLLASPTAWLCWHQIGREACRERGE